ncbi:M23 family metallopeptidase [Candidatus Sulfidibacterium hydrothermale]|uniref:M23 family metallopeptidase n=1 Tax=Candidatus Sulfidibacterium hydrothermale TaxID=2875962 RepID=UPI001F0AF2A2|nr:M23 family metallopeptidase [Candidatus Sulfidibacterium hydrothermale]UBM63460.1 M23 family metallopeptidase [Candidatus Sulfidibacterium hydrothermale]
MAKTRYFFNEKTLSYEEIKLTRGQKVFRFFLFLFSAIALTAVFVFILFNFFDSPKELMLKREIAEYKLQYRMMNDKLDKLQKLMDELEYRDDNIYRVIFEAEPIPKSVREAGIGGVDRYANLEGYDESKLLIETAKKLDKLTSEIYVQSKSFDEVFAMARNKEKMLASIPAIQPVRNIDMRRISSYFGYRIDPFYKVKKFHEGIDFSAPIGTPVHVTGDGVVIKVIRSNRGYGNEIIVDHGFGYMTRYAHLSAFKVKKGEHVKRGQVIGLVGNTGKSTAPHLHYEVIKNHHPINPINFFFNDLTPAEYSKMVALSKYPTQSMD